MEKGNKQITTDLIWYVIRPFGVFVILYELFSVAAAWTIPLFLKEIDGGDVFLIAHSDDLYAIITAAAMLLAGLPLVKSASSEIGWFEHRGRITHTSGNVLSCSAAFIGALSLSLSLNIILNLTGIINYSATAHQASLLTGSSMSAVGICVFGLLTPLIEEMVFRGIVYARADRGAAGAGKYEKVFPILITSLAFAVYHANLPQGLYAFIMSMVFCRIYSITEKFAAVYLVHAAINVMMIMLSGGNHGIFRVICTPGYAAAFAALAFVSEYCVWRGVKIERQKNRS